MNRFAFFMSGFWFVIFVVEMCTHQNSDHSAVMGTLWLMLFRLERK